MLNRIIIMGRLARDPELRRTQNGTPVASFRLAVDRDFKDKATGERSTDWIDVVAWRATAEFVSRFFTKGRMAVVEGRLQMRDWTDKDGNKRVAAEVVAENCISATPSATAKRPHTAAAMAATATAQAVILPPPQAMAPLPAATTARPAAQPRPNLLKLTT